MTITPNISELIENYTVPLLKTAFALGFQQSEAEELVQDTFVAFLDAQSRFEGKSKPSTYLFGILYNKAREWRRQHSKEVAEEHIEDLFDSHFSSDGHWNSSMKKELTEPERMLHNAQIAAYLKQCLDKLPMSMRLIFTMRDVEGFKTDDIANQLNLSTNHIGVALFRARNRLRECLKLKGVS